MNVAIIGAGLAGLSCAHELEKHGINPVIYERNGFIGEQFPHVGAVLKVLARPLGEPLKYFHNKLGLDVLPLNTVNKIVHYSPGKTTVIKGNLGYFFERSKQPADTKNQIFSKLKNTQFIFNSAADYEPLSKQYDHVVIANGNNTFTNELGCWIEWVDTFVRGAVVLGDFDPNTLLVWLNKDYCKNGYAYLSPFDSKKASIILVATDVSEKEIDHFWELFLYTENIKYTIIEEFKLNHKSGKVYPHKVDNIFLTGNAAGTIDPFLGFGVISSVITGVMAARSIAEGRDYEKLISPLVRDNLQLYEFRKAFNTLNNSSYNLLVSSLGIPVLKHMVYYTPINFVSIGSALLKLKSRMK